VEDHHAFQQLFVGALDLLVDVEETDLVHGREFCNQVDNSCDQVDEEGEGGVVGVVSAEQEPTLENRHHQRAVSLCAKIFHQEVPVCLQGCPSLLITTQLVSIVPYLICIEGGKDGGAQTRVKQ
jgi:hypothetical protein